MTPDERMVWLNAHRAEPYYRLVTVAEVAIVEGQLRRAIVYESEFARVVEILKSVGYWDDHPNVAVAVTAATFDARRYERATTAAIEALEETVAGWSVNEKSDAAFIANPAQLLAVLEFLKRQAAAKPEPTPEIKP